MSRNVEANVNHHPHFWSPHNVYEAYVCIVYIIFKPCSCFLFVCCCYYLLCCIFFSCVAKCFRWYGASLTHLHNIIVPIIVATFCFLFFQVPFRSFFCVETKSNWFYQVKTIIQFVQMNIVYDWMLRLFEWQEHVHVHHNIYFCFEVEWTLLFH